MPLTRNCIAKIVLPVPVPPETRKDLPSGKPPSTNSSKPGILVLRRFITTKRITTKGLNKVTARKKRKRKETKKGFG
jgi:hypothetical protein